MRNICKIIAIMMLCVACVLCFASCQGSCGVSEHIQFFDEKSDFLVIELTDNSYMWIDMTFNIYGNGYYGEWYHNGSITPVKFNENQEKNNVIISMFAPSESDIEKIESGKVYDYKNPEEYLNKYTTFEAVCLEIDKSKNSNKTAECLYSIMPEGDDYNKYSSVINQYYDKTVTKVYLYKKTKSEWIDWMNNHSLKISSGISLDDLNDINKDNMLPWA